MGNQNDPISFLRQRFSEGTLHHGLILHGHDLSGVVEEACSLSRLILDLEEDRFLHPDLFHLRPEGKSRIIPVEKTRNLIGELNRTSNQGGAKVAIIHEIDRMKKASANAFLKTLEEPPADTFLILLTTRLYSILPTIRSRCMQVRITREKKIQSNENWLAWTERYESWILNLMDREAVKKDRTTPVFSAYGLAAQLLKMITEESTERTREALAEQSLEMEDKEKDALEAGIRRGTRTQILRKLVETTRDLSIKSSSNNESLSRNGEKLARVLKNLEDKIRLMEVNLRDEVALEDFYLSSLRIWSSK